MQETAILVGLYLCNVIVLALPFALLEIWLEKFKSGWAGEFYNSFWGRKIHIKFFLSYMTVYHLVAFSSLAMLLVLEFFGLRSLTENGGFWIMDVAGIRFVPVIFLLSVWIGVAELEDFLWFALNWRYRGAMKRLLWGEVKWHVSWVNITRSRKLPRMYFIGLFAVIALFVLQYIIIELTTSV
jgi:hypothetical protein